MSKSRLRNALVQLTRHLITSIAERLGASNSALYQDILVRKRNGARTAGFDACEWEYPTLRDDAAEGWGTPICWLDYFASVIVPKRPFA
jgi:hypothetical protein